MRVTVQLFGPLAERAGRSRFEVEVAEGTVQAVIAASGLPVDRSVRFAVNTDYAEPSARVRDGDTVSFIPPVGGG
jgi:molybdopterin converting factor small subunit